MIQIHLKSCYSCKQRYLQICKGLTLSQTVDCPCQSVGFPGGAQCQGKVTDGSCTGQGAISARCRMPSNTSTIQGDSTDSMSELCYITTIHKRAQQQAMVLTLFCRAVA